MVLNYYKNLANCNTASKEYLEFINEGKKHLHKY